MNPPLPVCRWRPVVAGLADLGVEGIWVLVLVVWMDVGVIVSGAVGPAVATVHRAVQSVDACVRVLLLRGPFRRAAYVQDFGVVPFPGLTLSQLPGLGLDPDGEDCNRYVDIKNQVFLVQNTIMDQKKYPSVELGTASGKYPCNFGAVMHSVFLLSIVWMDTAMPNISICHSCIYIPSTITEICFSIVK